ncbi:MAG: hypothetical protein KGR26_02120 [Cyanobacteria bacterium REEB65]|nr:hypothetical protein [Cyanobacteria bacterium REEB65]
MSDNPLSSGLTPNNSAGLQPSASAPQSLAPSATPTASSSSAPTSQPPGLGTYEALAVAGDASGSAGNTGDGGPATAATFTQPAGLATGSGGSVYVADYGNHKVRKISSDGIVSTVAGWGAFGFSGDGGLAIDAQLNHPYAVALSGAGLLTIADYGNNRIRQVDGNGIIQTLAGGGSLTPATGQAATDSALVGPAGLAFDSAGNLYVAEFGGQRVDRIDPSGKLTVVAGTGTVGDTGDGGPATAASLDQPVAVLPDGKGDLYIADFGNQRVRMVDSSGMIHTVAGTGTAGAAGDGGAAIGAELHGPASLLLLADGTLVIADSANAEIRALAPDGTLRSIAGTGTSGNSGDGGPALSAMLGDPIALAASGSAILVSDFGNNRIRALVPVN